MGRIRLVADPFYIKGVCWNEQGTQYKVAFDLRGSKATCECPWYTKHRSPCKHLVALAMTYIQEDARCTDNARQVESGQAKTA